MRPIPGDYGCPRPRRLCVLFPELTLQGVTLIDLDSFEVAPSLDPMANLRALSLTDIYYDSLHPIGDRFCRIFSALFPQLTKLHLYFAHDKSYAEPLYNEPSLRELAQSRFVDSFDTSLFVNLKQKPDLFIVSGLRPLHWRELF